MHEAAGQAGGICGGGSGTQEFPFFLPMGETVLDTLLTTFDLAVVPEDNEIMVDAVCIFIDTYVAAGILPDHPLDSARVT